MDDLEKAEWFIGLLKPLFAEQQEMRRREVAALERIAQEVNTIRCVLDRGGINR